MPEDEPGTLSIAEARAVANYIYDAFYSAVARDRNRPARIELARLTVNQYRRAVADLTTSFAKPAAWGSERGLSGEYFTSRQPTDIKRRVATRLDPQIDFNFGRDAPVPEIVEPYSYSIRWTGSVLPPTTGEYAFIVRTEHAARLWVNDRRQPLIDAWVRSGTDTEHRAMKFLVSGRPCFLKLEFAKAKQGVGDRGKAKKKRESAEAAISLMWRRPHGVGEPIASRYLSPDEAPETFICDTPFPPDDRSYGWERGTAISPAWDDATTAAAISAASHIGERLDQLAGSETKSFSRQRKLRSFGIRFAERAFRQPLNDDYISKYIDEQFRTSGDAETAMRRVVLMVLKSPRFLFREIGRAPAAYQIAARLSFALWDSIPDQPLFDAARTNKLADEDDVRQQAERMISDPRAKSKLRDFLLTWLRLDSDDEVVKDAQKFSGFDAATVADLRTSLELFLDDIVWSEASDYRQLLLADDVYLNERLAKFYGAAPQSSEDFAKVRLDDGKRAGVLTHPLVLARYAYADESSPIHRGVFLARGILGRSLRPPPEAFTPLAPELHPDLTTRERVSLQTKDAGCMACHAIINPLGFALEGFDAVGRMRDTDRGKAINDTVEYQSPERGTVQLHGARELAAYLAKCEECRSAFIEQLFHHLVQQPVRAYGPAMLDKLRESFARHQYNIRELVVEIMAATAMVNRDTVGKE
jgi:hypothetical protein